MSDPFSTSPAVLKISGDQIIAKQPLDSIACCFGLFCLHYLPSDFPNLLRRHLTSNGVGLFVNISPKSPLFGNADFNKLFFKFGFDNWTYSGSSTVTFHKDSGITSQVQNRLERQINNRIFNIGTLTRISALRILLFP